MLIAKVSEKFDISPDTLRYYERIGLIPRVNRNKSGIRGDYTEEDCRWVEHVKCMRGIGLPIEGLIEYAGLYQQGDATIGARRELLAEQHKLLQTKIDEMNKVLARMNEKIERYDQSLS